MSSQKQIELRDGIVSDWMSMKKILLRTVIFVLAIAALAYVVDYFIWRVRVATNHNPYSSVTVQYYYAIGEKNNKTEYDFQPPQQETCVNSLFPHSGYSPCWYERKHTEKAIQV